MKDPKKSRSGKGGSKGQRHAGPSTQPVKEGIEGAILDDDGAPPKDSGRQAGSSPGSGKPTGAGAEAAVGMHAFAGQDDEGRSRSTPAPGSGNATTPASDVERAGSEPLRGTSQQHVSGYGGGGRGPRNSSDTREPLDYEGSGGRAGDEESARDEQHERPH